MVKTVLAFITILLAFRPALAREGNSFISNEMKRTEAVEQMEIQRANLNFNGLHQGQLSPSQNLENYPVSGRDPLFDNLEPIRAGEQMGALERPRGGISKATDPTDVIGKELSDKQEYQRYRNNYRKAVQNEFDKNARAGGVETDRNIAEEIKKLEALSYR